MNEGSQRHVDRLGIRGCAREPPDLGGYPFIHRYKCIHAADTTFRQPLDARGFAEPVKVGSGDDE